jgi:hypothetical protein
MKLQSLEILNARLRQLVPEGLEKCCPRRIVPPNAYPNPQALAGQLYAYTKLPEDKEMCADLRRATANFLHRLTPTYFVGNDFLRACLATEAPEVMTVGDIHFPIEAFVMVLSWEVQRELFHGLWAPFIQVHVANNQVHLVGALYADNAENTPITAELKIPFTSPIRSVTGMSEVVLDWGAVTDIHVSKIMVRERKPVVLGRERDAELEAEAKAIFEKEGVKGLRKRAQELTKEADKLDEQIDELDAKLISLDYVAKSCDDNKAVAEKAIGRVAAAVLKVVLALTARPELVEASTLMRPAKVRNGETIRDALWSPVILGRNYRLTYDPSVNRAHVGSKRMHWRRGHYRNQRHGLGFSLVKLIWIEPVLVNAPEE